LIVIAWLRIPATPIVADIRPLCHSMITRLRSAPDSWLTALYNATAPVLPQMPGEALSQLAWGLGQMGVTPPPAWADALALAAAALVNSQASSSNSGGQVSGLQITNVLWALAQWQHRPGEDTMRALMGAAQHHCLTPGGGGTPTDLSTLLWSAGRLGYLPDESWLDDWLTAADGCMRAGRYSPSHYVTAALELGRWGVVPAAAWRDTFYRSSKDRCVEMEGTLRAAP